MQHAPSEHGERTEVMVSDAASSMPTEPHLLMQGERVGDYVVERLLGQGGGGVVYAARSARSGQPVALKLLRAEMAVFPVMVARFAREIEALKRLAHPSIVAFYAYGELAPGRPYYAMELLDGVDLRTWLARSGRLSPSEARALFEPICEAVEAAHRAGIIHRDLKAHNVMVVAAHGTHVAKLCDFGIAKLLAEQAYGQGLTEPGAVIGSTHSMAPEQVRCEPVDARTDVYALGVLLFQLLTGQLPFQAADPHRVAMLHLTAPAPRPSLLAQVSPAVDALVLRCMEKQPERRFASVGELLAALRGALGEAADEAARGRALAVHIELVGAAAELDDARIAALMSALDELEATLTQAGFVLALATTSALLGVRLLRTDDAPERTIEALHAALASSPLVLAVRARVGELAYRDGAAGFEILGGELLELERWDVPVARLGQEPG